MTVKTTANARIPSAENLFTTKNNRSDREKPSAGRYFYAFFAFFEHEKTVPDFTHRTVPQN